MSNPNVREGEGYIYGAFQTGEKTWSILNEKQFVYLLIGDEKAALIDTLYGYGDLRQIVEKITDKEVMPINTHGHFDHTGGNSFWPKAWMSEEATSEAKYAFSDELRDMMNSHAYPDYECCIVKDGDIIELGNHTLEIIKIACHSAGSIAILDKTERILYTGDELESGQVLIASTKVQMHLDSMLKLAEHADEFDYINSAHNGTHLVKDYLYDFIELDKRLLAGTAEQMETADGFGWKDQPGEGFGGGKRYKYGRAEIVFVDLIK